MTNDLEVNFRRGKGARKTGWGAKFFLLVLIVAVAFLLAGHYLPISWQPIPTLVDSWALKENRDGPVIGDLGGVPVSIPRAFAHFVEYDGDPHFMEKRNGPAPKRTFQSKLRSFGFEVLYPDMASEEVKTPEERLKQPNIYTTKWMRVGINTGEFYGGAGDESLERLAENPIYPEGLRYSYQPLPEPVYGLKGFTPIGVDESARDLASGKGADMRDKNIYVYRDETGRVVTYIECGNMTHSADRCEQEFNLRPTIRAHVRVNYRRDLLPRWREIQTSVSQVILGFQADPHTTTPSK